MLKSSHPLRTPATLALSLTLLSGCANTKDQSFRESGASQAVAKVPPSLEEAMFDEGRLRERAVTWRSESPEVLASVASHEHILNAVAAFHFRDDLTSTDHASLRAGLDIARAISHDRYEQSLIDIYSILPVPPFAYGMSYAPDAVRLVQLSDADKGPVLVPGRRYLPATVQLAQELEELCARLPHAETLSRPSTQTLDFKPSPFFEAIFAREAPPAAIERRARFALAEIVSGMKADFQEYAAPMRGNLVPAQVLLMLYRSLRHTHGVTDAVQPSISAGLATKTFDCDVYTLVMCEFGKQLRLPIEAIYIFDPGKVNSPAHCLPAIVLEGAGGTRYVAFETREPIERLPDGSERRVYRSYQEMIERVNNLAGEEIFGESTIICVLTDEAKVRLVHPFGTKAAVDLTSRDLRILSGGPTRPR